MVIYVNWAKSKRIFFYKLKCLEVFNFDRITVKFELINFPTLG